MVPAPTAECCGDCVSVDTECRLSPTKIFRANYSRSESSVVFFGMIDCGPTSTTATGMFSHCITIVRLPEIS
jgi:hypothetical protein